MRHFLKETGRPTNDILSLHLDHSNTLWIGTLGGGLVRLKEGKFVSISTKNGLHNKGIYSILEDAGSLWMGSSSGIFRVFLTELNHFANGEIPAIHSLAFTEKDGMISGECNGGQQPAGWRTSTGHLWFPTTHGIVKVDPKRLHPNDVPPPIQLEQLLVDNKAVVPSKEEFTRIKPEGGRFEFRFAGLSFAEPEGVRYRFKLVGFDPDWIDGGSRRSAFYTNLRPGKYTFRVAASNSDGVWSRQAAAFSFLVAPHIHQTWWFYVICGAAILLLTFGIHRLRVRRLHSIKKPSITPSNMLAPKNFVL